MNQEYIEEQNIIQRYLQNNLTEDEAAQFEIYMMDNDEIFEQVKLDGIYTENLSAVVLDSQEDKSKFQWLAFLFGTASGASALLMVLWFFVSPSIQMADQVTNIVYLETLRSGEQAITKIVKQETGQLILVTPVAPGNNGPYQVTIKNNDESFLLTLNKVLQSNTGDITIALNQQALSTGIYTIVLVDTKGVTEQTQQFTLVSTK